MPDTWHRPGKTVDIGALVSDGRRRVGGSEEPAAEQVGEGLPAEQPGTGELPAQQSPGQQSPPAQRRPTQRQKRQRPAQQPRVEELPASRPSIQPHQAEQPLIAFYVRLPGLLKERVDDASHALRRMKATNQEIIAALIEQEVDPATEEGLGALTERLERYRRSGTLGR
jgi:hypothetical protein